MEVKMKRLFVVLFAFVLFAAPTVEAVTSRSAASQITPGGKYAALGDSIAAGYGLNGTFGCGRSEQAYPYQVARAHNLSLAHVACSGATTQDVMNIQLNQAFAGGTPQLLTITVGANDMQWASYLRKCYAQECGSKGDSADAKVLRTNLEQRYRTILAEIQRRSGGTPPVVVITGYSNPISNYCKGRQSFVTNKEINWLNSQRNALNSSIRKSMRDYPFVKYASTNFKGHAMCSPESWVQPLNDSGRLHPDAQGQTLIANSILKVLGSK
jgi:lysophospholipase L1-like esterase